VTAAVDGDRELHASVAQRLGEQGQRYSTGRRRLVAGLVGADRPVTIPELLESMPEMAQSSAYRNLSVLEQVGVVSRVVTFGEHARFELAEDLMGHHHHLICTSCGRVEDFIVPDAVERTVDEAMASVVAPTGFAPTAHRLDLLGTCRSCQRRRS
jgi:Fe2+ or Zn2+ uptake regulation protein